MKENKEISVISWIIPLTVFFGGIGGGVAFPIIPLLGVRLKLSGALIGAILSAPRAARLICNQPAGMIVDRIGGKLPLVIGLLIESVGSLFYVLALHSSMPGLFLLLGRTIFGIGSSLLIVGGNTLALNLSRHSNRGRSTAAVRTAQSLGNPGGMVIGGIIVGFWGEEIAFWTATLIALFGGLLILLSLKEQPHAEAAKDRGSLWYAILYTLRSPSLLIVCLFNTLIFFSMQGVLLTTLVLFLEKHHITIFQLASQTASGLLMAIMMVSSAIASIVVGRTIDKSRTRTFINFPALALLIAGYIILALFSKLPAVIISLLILGIGMGATNIPLLTLLGDITPREIRGRSVGVYQFFGDIGGTLGPIIGVQVALTSGFTSIYLAVSGILLISSVLLVQVFKAENKLLAKG